MTNKWAETQARKQLEALIKEQDNDHCADCKTRGPTWVSVTFGVFLCTKCAGIHRKLTDVVTSRVKSITLDLWTAEQVEDIKKKGNKHVNSIYEFTIINNIIKYSPPTTDKELEEFVRNKYEKQWYIKDERIHRQQPQPQQRPQSHQLSQSMSQQYQQPEPQQLSQSQTQPLSQSMPPQYQQQQAQHTMLPPSSMPSTSMPTPAQAQPQPQPQMPLPTSAPSTPAPEHKTLPAPMKPIQEQPPQMMPQQYPQQMAAQPMMQQQGGMMYTLQPVVMMMTPPQLCMMQMQMQQMQYQQQMMNQPMMPPFQPYQPGMMAAAQVPSKK